MIHNFHRCNSHPLWSTVDTKSYWWKTSRSSLLPRFCFRLARLTLWDRPRWIVGKVGGRWISPPSKRISCPLSFRFMIYRTVHLPWTDDYHTSLFWLFSDFPIMTFDIQKFICVFLSNQPQVYEECLNTESAAFWLWPSPCQIKDKSSPWPFLNFSLAYLLLAFK